MPVRQRPPIVVLMRDNNKELDNRDASGALAALDVDKVKAVVMCNKGGNLNLKQAGDNIMRSKSHLRGGLLPPSAATRKTLTWAALRPPVAFEGASCRAIFLQRPKV